MRQIVSKKLALGIVAGVLVGGLFAADVSARGLWSESTIYYLYGANQHGNRSSQNGGFAVAKFTKIPGLGIILGVAKGNVTNRSGWPQLYINRGNPVLDPQTGYIYNSTSDLQTIARRGGVGKARSGLLMAYCPQRGYGGGGGEQ